MPPPLSGVFLTLNPYPIIDAVHTQSCQRPLCTRNIASAHSFTSTRQCKEALIVTNNDYAAAILWLDEQLQAIGMKKACGK